MKIIIAYPPLNNEKGCPTLGQNRQFQYFKDPTYIYPVVPATAATLLKKSGHEAVWLDCLAERLSYDQFLEIIKREKPDIIAFETKTPVINEIWKIVDEVKDRSPALGHSLWSSGGIPRVVLFGDHVTALPAESFQNSQVDFVITGGDYDFLLLNLCNFLQASLNPDLQSKPENLEKGIYYRQDGRIANTGKFELNHDLNSLPFIDRDLTKWLSYAYENGNFKRTPGTYIMSGRDCWWGKCTFCSWPTLYPKFRVRSAENVLDELEFLVKNYSVREVMDDTGCLSAGDWLKQFCNGMISRGINRKIYFDCNMRFGALSEDDFKLMKKANFRLLLFGLESANQKTMDRINKNLLVERVIRDCKAARRAGLFPHITIMFGYPWESFEDASNTLKLGQWLLKKGYAYTMQATIVIPYPGSPLFAECKSNGWLRTLDWNNFDMKKPVMRTDIPDEKLMQLVQGMYGVSFQPEFILRKLFSIRDFDDLNYYLRASRKVFGHIFDFRRK